jgi:uncharacterized membrane protein
MIETKEVVLGALGAAAALAGLVLVFLGIIIAAYQSYAGNAPASVVRPYRIAGVALFGTFSLSLVTVALCMAWLALGGPHWLYGWTVGFFVMQLVAAFVAAGWTTRMVLWP